MNWHFSLGLRTCADSVAPDPPVHPRILTWELHCPLISQWYPFLQISGQCSSQVRLRGCAGWSGAALSAPGRRQMTSAASQGLKCAQNCLIKLKTEATHWNVFPHLSFNKMAYSNHPIRSLQRRSVWERGWEDCNLIWSLYYRFLSNKKLKYEIPPRKIFRPEFALSAQNHV